MWRNTPYREQKRGVIVRAVKDTVWTMLSLRTVCHADSLLWFTQNSSVYTQMLGFSVLYWLKLVIVMIFILYKLYILKHNSKPTHYKKKKKLYAFLQKMLQKTSLSMIYKLFSSWDQKCTHKVRDFWFQRLVPIGFTRNTHYTETSMSDLKLPFKMGKFKKLEQI